MRREGRVQTVAVVASFAFAVATAATAYAEPGFAGAFAAFCRNAAALALGAG